MKENADQSIFPDHCSNIINSLRRTMIQNYHC